MTGKHQETPVTEISQWHYLWDSAVYLGHLTIKTVLTPWDRKGLPKSKYLQVSKSFTTVQHHCLLPIDTDWGHSAKMVQINANPLARMVECPGNTWHGFTPHPWLKGSGTKVSVCTRKKWGRRDKHRCLIINYMHLKRLLNITEEHYSTNQTLFLLQSTETWWAVQKYKLCFNTAHVKISADHQCQLPPLGADMKPRQQKPHHIIKQAIALITMKQSYLKSLRLMKLYCCLFLVKILLQLHVVHSTLFI